MDFRTLHSTRINPLLRGLWISGVVAIVIGSLLPASSPEIEALSTLPVSDKVMHFAAYLGVALLAAWVERRPAALAVCAGLVIVGAALELLQRLVPGRSCDVMDWVADCGGVVLGFLLGAAVSGKLRRSLTGQWHDKDL